MASTIYKARLDKEYERKFNILKNRLKTDGLYGEDSKTFRLAIDLALKHLDLRDKIKEVFGGLLF